MIFTSNPFSELAEFIPPIATQLYVLAMFLFVIGGTLFDVIHKKSAEYFFENSKRREAEADKKLTSGEKTSIAVKTVAEDVLTSAEFCNPKRRMSHLLTMYGFIFFVASTAIMVAFYPEAGASTPSIWPILWHLGALMVMIGGYWFWFFIRVDLAAEGNPWNRIVRADMFILSLLATTTFGFLWSVLQSQGVAGWTTAVFVLFIISSTVLFGGVIWSKFAHMFFKPAAAYNKRIVNANGSRDGLPAPADRTNPADSDRHSMELLKDAPMNMGLGIKREEPKHY